MKHKNSFICIAAFICILLIITARHHPPSRRKIKEIWHGRVYWEGELNTTMLRSSSKINEITPVETTVHPVETTVQPMETNIKHLPDVYFILMTGKSERVQHVQQMMKEHPSLNAKIWPAVIPGVFHDPIYSPYLNKDSFKKVRHGAIGCALSHITLLEHMIRENMDEIIVFEDDATLSPTFEEEFHEYKDHLPGDFEFGQFLHHKSMKSLRGQSKYKLNPYVMKSYAPFGTVGYLITLAGAKKLLPTLKPIWYPIDEMYRAGISKKIIVSYIPVKDLVTMPYKLSSNIWGTAKKPLEPLTSKPINLPKICQNFPLVWKGKTKSNMLVLLRFAHEMFEELGIEYVIHSGTALGYLRHNKHQMPWDDDIDLYIRARDTTKVKKYIDKSSVYCHGSLWLGFKVFRCDSPKIGAYKWSYPMIDIFTTTNAWNTNKIMWPSKLSKFESQTVRIPADINAHLVAKYGPTYFESCLARGWDHQTEKGTGFSGRLPCKDLVAKCGSQWPTSSWPIPYTKSSVKDNYEWKNNIDIVIPSSFGLTPSKEVERSRTGDHSLYWVLISISKNAPWIRNIYLLVNGNIELPYELPSNINVKIVNRCDYMTHCPTKNSQAVYTMIHKIPGLSEHFIATQDDIILGRPATWKDFFTSDGKPFSWREKPTWNDGVMGAHHRIYVKPEVFSGKTPTSAGPCPHFMYPVLKSFAIALANEYKDWYTFVESHKEGRFSSESNSINDKRNSQEEAMNGIWESNLITSKRGVYKNINNQRGKMWDEVSISKAGFDKAIRNKPMFMNVNDRFSKVADKYKEQVRWFWKAMEKLFGIKMKLKMKIPNSSWPRLYSPQKNIINDQLDIKMQDITGRSKIVSKPTTVFWQRDAFTDPSVYEDASGCEQHCRVVSNVQEADILMSTHSPVTKVKNDQLTIHFSRESLKTHGKNIAQFDLTMDMSPLSNIPITSIPSNFWQTMHDMPVPTKDNIKKRKLAVWYGSNCDNTAWPRTKYLQELSQYMDIDFPGKCLHNTPSVKPRSDFKTNADLYKKYLFVFGFHNALDNRNIDEKMFHAFMGKSVNVVMAHDIMYYFAPGKNSFVDASRFASPKELAEYLLYLQAHPDEYLKFFEYRKETTQPKVLAMIQETSIYQKGNLCRVCACVADEHCRAKRTVSQSGYIQMKKEITPMPRIESIDILLAPYGPESGISRRTFHLDDSEPLHACNKVITRHYDTSTVSDIIATADVVWMDCVWVHKNMKALRAKLISLNIEKPKHQRWICGSTETSTYYPHLYPFAQLRRTYPEIDVVSTNRLDSDIPLIEIGNVYGVSVDKILHAPPFTVKTPKVLIMYNNCNAKSGRQTYIKSFIDSYPSLVVNYGKCWGGKSTNNAYTHNGVVEKLKRLGKHMFSFCIENSYVKDYVSEKVYQSLAEGSIPIYKGAPNAKDLIPCENCVIWVDDYPTADALANHLQYLIKNKDAYEEYFKWKKSPRMDVIQTLKDYSIDSALCRWTNTQKVIDTQNVYGVVVSKKDKNLCFAKEFPSFLPGKWVIKEKSKTMYGRASTYKEWNTQACYAETTLQSCFFQGFGDRALRLHNREWLPDTCNLLHFDAETFVSRFSGYTIVFEGDSVIAQQFQSLLCLLAGYEIDTTGLNWRDETRKWNTKKNCPEGPQHCYFAGSGTTNCVKFKNDIKICTKGLDYRKWNTYDKKTIVLINEGLHLKNDGISGNPLLKKRSQWFKEILKARDETPASIIWVETTQQHFDSIDGSYELSKTKRCSNRKLDLSKSPRFIRDSRIMSFMEKNKFPILSINGYDNTMEAHVIFQDRHDSLSGDDCTHFCLPGLPDHWNRLLYNYLMNLPVTIIKPVTVIKPSPTKQLRLIGADIPSQIKSKVERWVNTKYNIDIGDTVVPNTLLHNWQDNIITNMIPDYDTNSIMVKKTNTKPSFFMAMPGYKTDYISKSIMRTGKWENVITTFFEYIMGEGNVCSPETTVVDIGANIGYFSGYLMSTGCKVISIELQARMANWNIATMMLNQKYDGQMNHYSMGLSNEKMTVKIHSAIKAEWYVAEIASANSGDYYKSLRDKDKYVVEKARLRTFDDIFGHVESIYFLKMDIDGHECKALDGMRKTIALKKIKHIQLEFDPFLWKESGNHANQYGLEIANLLVDAGYHFYIIPDPRFNGNFGVTDFYLPKKHGNTYKVQAIPDNKVRDWLKALPGLYPSKKNANLYITTEPLNKLHT